MRLRTLVMMVVTALFVAGCSPSDSGSGEASANGDEAARAEDSQESQGAVGKVVDEVTGLSHLRRKQKMEKKINQINEDRQKQIEEALGEE